MAQLLSLLGLAVPIITGFSQAYIATKATSKTFEILGHIGNFIAQKLGFEEFGWLFSLFIISALSLALFAWLTKIFKLEKQRSLKPLIFAGIAFSAYFLRGYILGFCKGVLKTFLLIADVNLKVLTFVFAFLLVSATIFAFSRKYLGYEKMSQRNARLFYYSLPVCFVILIVYGAVVVRRRLDDPHFLIMHWAGSDADIDAIWRSEGIDYHRQYNENKEALTHAVNAFYPAHYYELMAKQLRGNVQVYKDTNGHDAIYMAVLKNNVNAVRAFAKYVDLTKKYYHSKGLFSYLLSDPLLLWQIAEYEGYGEIAQLLK